MRRKEGRRRMREREKEGRGGRRDKESKRQPKASNGQRYPLPCCTHFGNLKCAQQGKGEC